MQHREMTVNPENQAYLDAFNRRFVSLCWVDCKVDAIGPANEAPRTFCTSGFVIEYRGEWLWITAGHLLNDLDNELPRIGRRILQSQFIAGWNPNEGTVQHIPFEYGTRVKYYVVDDDEGTDLGMVHVSDVLKLALSEAGVVPLRNLSLPEQAYEQYLVHGLPSKEQRLDIEESAYHIDYVASVMPVTFRVFPLTTESGGFAFTKRRRFIASVPAEVPLTTIDGMSGGPIYALTRETNGICCYLAAVQNEERQSSRTIAACPSDIFHEILETGFADIQLRRWR
jgi:hypothetical protein